MSMSDWKPYLIAAVTGLLIGIEREKTHPRSSTMGVRTFLLIALLGAFAGGLKETAIAFSIAIFALALIVVSYFNQTRTYKTGLDRGLTTEFAAGLVFGLGFIAHQSPTLAALLGPVIGVVLFSKKILHRFSHALKESELEAALLILLLGVVAIDLLPNRLVDPWGIFNPQKFGYLVLILAVLEFVSYFFTKLLGEKSGSVLVGFLGGFVSSTAVLLSSARQSKKNPKNLRNFVQSALAAKIAAIVQLLVIVGMVSPTLLYQLFTPMGLIIAYGATFLFYVSRGKGAKAPTSALSLRSPLDLRGVLRLATLLAAILAAVSFAKLWFGDQGTLVIAFLTGLFELHGITLATATMFNHQILDLQGAKTAILLGTGASFAAKIAISWGLSTQPFARTLTLAFFPMLAIAFLFGLLPFLMH